MARILVVEDDADLRAELMDALCLFGHDVIGAEDGLKSLLHNYPLTLRSASHAPRGGVDGRRSV